MRRTLQLLALIATASLRLDGNELSLIDAAKAGNHDVKPEAIRCGVAFKSALFRAIKSAQVELEGFQHKRVLRRMTGRVSGWGGSLSTVTSPLG